MTYVMLRMNRWVQWVRWSTSDGNVDPRPKRVVSCMGKLLDGNIQQTGDTSRAYESLCPVDRDEAVQTDVCVRALPRWARDTVTQDYLVGGTQQQKADALQISTRAFRYRRDALLPMLLEMFNLAAVNLPLELADETTRRAPNIS